MFFPGECSGISQLPAPTVRVPTCVCVITLHVQR